MSDTCKPTLRRTLSGAAFILTVALAASACTTELSSQHTSTKSPTTAHRPGTHTGTAASDGSHDGSTATDDTASNSDSTDSTSASDHSSSGAGQRPPTTDPKGTAGDGTLVVAKECRPGPGKTVTQQPDVVIPAVHQPATTVASMKVDGHTVPGFSVGSFDRSEQVVDGGCVIEHDAPGGCLGAVEITGVSIPAQDIPGYELPDLRVGGKRLAAGEAVAGDRVAAVSVPGASTPQVCQHLPSKDSRYIAQVTRPAVTRAAASRGALSRGAGSRSSATYAGQYIDSVYVDSAYVDSVFVDSVFVDSKLIDAVELPDTTTNVFSNDQQSSYFAPADVLFDFNKSDIKADAAQTLQAIAQDVKQNFPTGTIQVDGHTDSIGDDATNQTLSEQRAEAVKQWLSTQGGIPADRMTTKGYGESVPVTPNTNPDGSDNPDGRAQNRRVVITAHH